MNAVVLTIAKLVKRHRIALNMTRIELARMIGLPNGQLIYAIENGLSRIPTEKVQRLCEALKIPPKMMADLMISEHEDKINSALGLK